MDATIALTIISFILALIGSFTETTIKKQKSPTTWGYILIVLLATSAGIGVYTELNNLKTQKVKDEQTAKKEQQQRLLSLMSVSSNFEISQNPMFDLCLPDSIMENGQDADSTAHLFPGFGLKNISYVLALNPTDDKQDVISGDGLIDGYSHPAIYADSVTKKTRDTTSDNSFKISGGALEEINNEANCLWPVSGYKNLLEVLIDFEAGNIVGKITFKKKSGKLSNTEFIKLVNAMNKRKGFNVKVYIKGKNLNERPLYLGIEVKLSKPRETSGALEYDLILGDPQLAFDQYDPAS